MAIAQAFDFTARPRNTRLTTVKQIFLEYTVKPNAYILIRVSILRLG